MLIDSKKLKKPLQVKVDGHEEWLFEIYKTFPAPCDVTAPKMTASFMIQPNSHDPSRIDVQGECHYTPYVQCARCDRPMLLPLSLSFDATFVAKAVNASPRKESSHRDNSEEEILLSTEDLDTYELSSQGEIDLEALLNEHIQIAIPIRTIHESEQQSECIELLGAEQTPLKIFSTAKEKHSPFSKLAELYRDV